MTSAKESNDERVDISYNLQRREARSIMRRYWRRRLIKISPAMLILVLFISLREGPPYWLHVIIGVLIGVVVLALAIPLADHRAVTRLCRPTRVVIGKNGIDFAHENESFRGYRWSSVNRYELSVDFLSIQFDDWQSIYVPIRALDSASTARIKAFSPVAITDVQKGLR